MIAYVDNRILGASLPLPCGFGLTLDMLNQLWDILFSLVYVLPNEFIGVGCGASIAPSTANEELAVILRRTRNPARRVFPLKNIW